MSSFDDHLAGLEDQAQSHGAAVAAPGVVVRYWNVPDTYPDDVDIQDPFGFLQACDRTDLNDDCTEAYETGGDPNSGRMGQVMANKIAIDNMGAYERALHARHASAVRCRAWACARRAGHADDTYGVFGCLARFVQDFLDAAEAIDNAPEG
jgi:hypothetical protein